MINIVINHRYLQNYKEDYIQEIFLISRIGHDYLKRLPLLSTTVIVNIIAAILSWILCYILYKFINYIYYLDFCQISVSLLLILLTAGIGNGFLTCYYIFKLK